MKSSVAATAYVIRDKHGSLIQAAGKLLNHASVPFVELIAIGLGLCAAIYKLNATHILMEGVSATVVSWINTGDISHKSRHFT